MGNIALIKSQEKPGIVKLNIELPVDLVERFAGKCNGIRSQQTVLARLILLWTENQERKVARATAARKSSFSRQASSQTMASSCG